MIDNDRRAHRLSLVREHVKGENDHDLDAVMRTFGSHADYYDEPWGDHHAGLDGVRDYYAGLMQSLPDLLIDVQREHISDDHVILEVVIRGTHRGAWRGLPATGRTVAIPLCGVFTFDDDGRLASERIYYDRATALQQLGVFHDPEGVLGRLATMFTHPVTMIRIGAGQIRTLLRGKKRDA